MPQYVCFCCGKTFRGSESKLCKVCKWRICPHCGGCLCKLTVSEQRVAKAVYKTYAPSVGYHDVEEFYRDEKPKCPSCGREMPE